MNKLLLTSALVAVAGVASAEVTWSGDAEFGYNDQRDGNGLYVEGGIDATASAELDNGITASVTYGLDIDYAAEHPDTTVNVVSSDNFPTITLESEVATLTVGDTAFAAENLFNSYGETALEFGEVDGEAVARLDMNISSFQTSASYVVSGAEGGANTDDLSVALAGDFSGVNVGLAYEQGETDDLIGLSIGYTAGAIDGGLTYLTSGDDSSIGLGGTYTMSNGLALGLGLGSNSVGGADTTSAEISVGFEAAGADIALAYNLPDVDNTDNAQLSLDVEYAVSGGTIYAGYDEGENNEIDADAADDAGMYVGATYDLGGGAELVASYATFDEAGDPEFKAGTTLAVSLSF